MAHFRLGVASSLAVLVSLAGGCGLAPAVDEPAADPALDEKADSPTDQPRKCSGIRGRVCPAGTWCQNDNPADPLSRDGVCVANDAPDDPWRTVLRPISARQADEAAEMARGVRFVDDGRITYPVAWSWISGNHCVERARMTQYALMLGSDGAPLPAAISDELLQQMVERKQIDAAQIVLFSWMDLQLSAFQVPGRAAALEHRDRISWYSHTATVINVAGDFRVIDLSASAAPLTIDEWLARYAPVDRVTCGRLSATDAADLNVYFNSKINHLPIEPSKVLCGYQISWGYNHTLEPADGFGSLRWDFAVQYTLTNDVADLKAAFEAGGRSLDDAEVPLVTSTFAKNFDEVCASPASCADACTDLKYTCPSP
jgi:hypothetical protein